MAKLSTQPVGSTVILKIDGSAKPFIIVHQGLPSSIYDSSCNGTWLQMQDAFTSTAWDYGLDGHADNDYANSDIHEFLNDVYFPLFDKDTQDAIKEVKIPYWNGTGSGGSLATGSSGLTCKVFLPAYNEYVAETTHFLPADGSRLSFFATVNQSNFSPYETWLRSPCTTDTISAGRMNMYAVGAEVTASHNIRPMMVMNGDCEVDSDGYIVPVANVNGTVSIGGSAKKLDKSYVNVGSSWKEVVKSYVNVGGVWKPTT